MRTSRLLILIILAIGLLGSKCTKDPDIPEFNYTLKSAKLIETNNDFGLKLLNTVLEEEESANVMISPASVSFALGMAYNGAESATRDAFEEVLDYQGLSREEVNEITKELIQVLLTNVKGNLLEIGNSIWCNEGFPVEPEFISLNSHYFDAEVNELDFSSSDAVETINDWVSRNTNGKIDKIIDSIDPSVMMFLINAIYFNAVWDVEFDPEHTKRDVFYNEDGSIFGQVDMMELDSKFSSTSNESFNAVELPYKDGKFSMFLFLPPKGTSVNQLAQELDGNTWNSWLEDFNEKQSILVSMPRFKFEFDRSLSEDLKAMGLDIAFTEEADFSGISEIDLFIHDVIHKTFIKVNEEGTEAAAVTAVSVGITSVGPLNEIRLDRPFLFAITENSSRSIIFMGKVAEPGY